MATNSPKGENEFNLTPTRDGQKDRGEVPTRCRGKEPGPTNMRKKGERRENRNYIKVGLLIIFEKREPHAKQSGSRGWPYPKGNGQREKDDIQGGGREEKGENAIQLKTASTKELFTEAENTPQKPEGAQKAAAGEGIKWRRRKCPAKEETKTYYSRSMWGELSYLER